MSEPRAVHVEHPAQSHADDIVLLRARSEHLTQALTSARTIGAAVGILMERQRLSYDDAFATLATLSQAHNRKVRDLAEDIVWTGVIPRPEAVNEARRTTGR